MTSRWISGSGICIYFILRRIDNDEKNKGKWNNRFEPDQKNSMLPAYFCLLHIGIGAGACYSRCKGECKVAMQDGIGCYRGGSSLLKFQTAKAGDCPIFTVAQPKKISSIAYLCDDKEVYSICVVKATKKSAASGLLKSIKAYKKNNSSNDYLADYSKTEQKVFKNAVCGKKGNYVWYIAMSSKKDVNKKGQDALKEHL